MLTQRQQTIYDFIVEFRRQNGCSPSIPEIQRQFGIRSPNGVAGHLNALKAKGVIRRGDRGSRSIDLVGDASSHRGEIFDIPVAGRIAAGFPESAGANSDETLSVDSLTLGFRPNDKCFALQVSGDSMKDAGILPGDMVVVDPSAAPRENQIIAALIDGECTLKRLVRRDGEWYLKAENPKYPDFHARSELAVQGAVRTLIRRVV